MISIEARGKAKFTLAFARNKLKAGLVDRLEFNKTMNAKDREKVVKRSAQKYETGFEFIQDSKWTKGLVRWRVLPGST